VATVGTEPQGAALLRTPLHDEHVRLGARMVPFAGWDMPVQYAGVVEEHHAVRRAAGIFDVSHMGEMEVTGPNALGFVDGLVTNDVKKLELGQAAYTVACNERGTILDDLIVYRVGDERVLVVCNASNRQKMVGHFADHASKTGVPFFDVSDDTALIAVQGPLAIGIASRGGADLAGLGSFRLLEVDLFDVRCTVARTGYTGEDGVELFCRATQASLLWRSILQAGADAGIKPCGLGARDTLRLEARLCLYGNDIDDTTNPLEAGLGWTVKMDKGEFIGRAALAQVKARGLERKLVGLEVTGRGIGRHGYPILDTAGATVGVVTSGSPSPTLGKNVALGYVPVGLSEIGSQLVVDCRGRKVDAVVVKTPFYKRAR
jgi:glycine cleavage system T protein (aminomethyltransferase)